jgi:hypothetical protein
MTISIVRRHGTRARAPAARSRRSDATPARIHSTPTLVENDASAALLVDPERERRGVSNDLARQRSATTPRAAMIAPRIRAARSA